MWAGIVHAQIPVRLRSEFWVNRFLTTARDYFPYIGAGFAAPPGDIYGMQHLRLFENFNADFKLTDLSYEQIEAFADWLAEDYQYQYALIESQASIIVYRVLGVHNHWEVDLDDAGIHWTTDKSLYGMASFFESIVLPHGYEKYIILSAEVDTADIDRQTTYEKNTFCPEEHEVTLRVGTKYTVIEKQEYDSLEELIDDNDPAKEWREED